MAAAFDCAPGRGAPDAPHVWAGMLESALSVATVSPQRAHAEEVRVLLRRVPDHGMTAEWRVLIDSARRWLAAVDARPLPVFEDLSVLNAAAAARPCREQGWQRHHAAICGE